MTNELKELLSFLDNNPTAYHTCNTVRTMLLNEGFEELLESDRWNLIPGNDYFVCRNGSSMIAFRMGNDLSDCSFNIAAAHTDSPAFKIKENAELSSDGHYTRLNTEGYGGMICSTWMDRPLSIAGRVIIKNNDAIESHLLNIDRDLLLIPNVAIHMNRDINEKATYNKQVDMLPLFSAKTEGNVLMDLIATELGVAKDAIIGGDLFLYIREKSSVWGLNNEFISSGRLDDEQCIFGILKGLIKSRSNKSIDVAAFFDNEEVGSATKQGAASTFLYDVLHRITMSLNMNEEDYHRALASSFMISADNAHAVHPNHPEYTDTNNCNYLNEGIVIKSHAGQKYTSDGISIAVIKELAAKADVPFQHFANRSDKAGGSTLGNLAMSQVSMNTVDIGLPQLAMHSAYETAGAKDIEYLIRLMEEFYKCHIKETGYGKLEISQ